MIKLFKWAFGRQGTGYEFFPLIYSTFFHVDMYLLRYRTGSKIPPHKDPAMPGTKHYRLNIVLWPAKDGGEFLCESCILNFGPIKLFRPDLNLHSVTEVKFGCRYVLSLGWLIKDK